MGNLDHILIKKNRLWVDHKVYAGITNIYQSNRMFFKQII
jgi:hypothetical protein